MAIPKLKLHMIHPGRPTRWPAMASARLDRPANAATTMCGVMTTMRIYTTWRHDADAEDVGGVTAPAAKAPSRQRQTRLEAVAQSQGSAGAGRATHHAIFLGVVSVWLDSAVANGVIRPAARLTRDGQAETSRCRRR